MVKGQRRSRRSSRSSRRSRGARPSKRRYGNVLGVGQSFFTKHLKLHRYSDSLRITDMQNAGKRGKKVRELTVMAKTRNEAAIDSLLKQAAESILDMDFSQAKRHLEGDPFELHERELRGIDVEPVGTTFLLSRTLPDGSIVAIDASPHTFLVRSSTLISAPNKAAHGLRQDTLYGPKSKKDGQVFYDWIKANLAKAGRMTIRELIKLWDALGVSYDSQ